jgi:hypothetical protein
LEKSSSSVRNTDNPLFYTLDFFILHLTHKKLQPVIAIMSTYGFTVILAAALFVAAVIAFTYNKSILYLARRRFAAEHDCKPIQSVRYLKDPIFGLDNMLEMIKAGKESRFLERAHRQFTEYGTTYRKHSLTDYVIVTIDPQNIKTILSVRFKEFGIGNREISLGRLLGRGIFTMDGTFWQHSRALIRPNFARDQVADLVSFERHIQDLWELIPRDGSTVDLQELFSASQSTALQSFCLGVPLIR